MPVPLNSNGRAVQPGAGDGGEVRPRALDERARVGQASLVALVELAVLALGQRQLGVAHHADGAPAVVVGAVEDEDGPVDPDLAGGQPDPVGGVHRLDHVGHQPGQLVVVGRDRLLHAVHDVLAPASDRAHDPAPGQRAVRRVLGLGGQVGHAQILGSRTGVRRAGRSIGHRVIVLVT